MKLVATKVDETQAQAAWDAYQQYIAVEADPAKKSRFKLEALQMLFDADAFDLAIPQSEGRRQKAEGRGRKSRRQKAVGGGRFFTA